MSTTGERTAANLIFMGFTNTTSLRPSATLCGGGMPSATTLGVENVWQQLLLKLDRMPECGRQSAGYSS
jgi:hypothetical protein